MVPPETEDMRRALGLPTETDGATAMTPARFDLPPGCANAENIMDKTTFRNELQALINRHSVENGSDTPDFILAEYLVGCLDLWDTIVRRREDWYG